MKKRGNVDTFSPFSSSSISFSSVFSMGSCSFDFFRYTLISSSFWLSSLSETSTLLLHGIVDPFGITTLYPISVSIQRSYGSKSIKSSDRTSSSVTPIQLAHYTSSHSRLFTWMAAPLTATDSFMLFLGL